MLTKHSPIFIKPVYKSWPYMPDNPPDATFVVVLTSNDALRTWWRSIPWYDSRGKEMNVLERMDREIRIPDIDANRDWVGHVNILELVYDGQPCSCPAKQWKRRNWPPQKCPHNFMYWKQ